MKRRLFNLIAGVSLLLCAGMAALWVRSHFRSDFLVIHRGRELSLTSNEGLLEILTSSHYRVSRTSPAAWTVNRLDYSPEWEVKLSSGACWDDYPPNFLPIVQAGDWWRGGPYPVPSTTEADSGFLVITKYWPLCVGFAVAPALWVYQSRRQRKKRIHNRMCVGCGYDLRATPQRCPECGTVPGKIAKT